MLAHLCLKFRTDSEGLQQQETLDTLPKAIRSSISHFLFYSLVDNVYLFRGVSNDLLFQLVILLKDKSIILCVCLCACASFYIPFLYYTKEVSSLINAMFMLKVSEMKAEYFPPKEDVILQNEAPTDFYILVTGAIVSSEFPMLKILIPRS